MKNFSFIFFMLSSLLIHGQEKNFQAETESIISSFEKTISVLGNTNASEAELKDAKKSIREIS